MPDGGLLGDANGTIRSDLRLPDDETLLPHELIQLPRDEFAAYVRARSDNIDPDILRDVMTGSGRFWRMDMFTFRSSGDPPPGVVDFELCSHLPVEDDDI